MKSGNKILRKYLRLCTRNFPITDYLSLSHKVICNKLKLRSDIEKNPGPSFPDAEVYASKASSCLTEPKYNPDDIAVYGKTKDTCTAGTQTELRLRLPRRRS